MSGSARSAARAAAGAAVLALAIGLTATSAGAVEKISYKEDVYPILEIRCMECHQPGGAGYEASGLDLRTYASLMAGTKHGPVIIPGDPSRSNFNVLVEGRAAPEIRMPHNRKPLTKCEVAILRDWVQQGALDN